MRRLVALAAIVTTMLGITASTATADACACGGRIFLTSFYDEHPTPHYVCAYLAGGTVVYEWC